jgi:sugar/nucleoside kinase (ribokinase family)
VSGRGGSGGSRDDLDLLVVGDVNPDVIVAGGEPAFGQQERLVPAIELVIGGSAGIMAAGAARLGLRVALVGVVGDDPFGRFMLDALHARGVDVSGCRVDGAGPTGASVILARPGDRAILTAQGTIAALEPSDVPAALVARARHVHVASWFLLDRLRPALPDVAAAAHGHGATVSLDPNGDPTDAWDGGLLALLPSVDVFLPNDAEARRIAGRADVTDAASVLAEWAAGGLVVVKRGAEGAIAARAGAQTVSAGAPRTAPLDTTGAGDSFDAGFLASWLEAGRPAGGPALRDCLAFAAACGALSTRALGGTAAQPTRDEVAAALASGGA